MSVARGSRRGKKKKELTLFALLSLSSGTKLARKGSPR